MRDRFSRPYVKHSSGIITRTQPRHFAFSCRRASLLKFTRKYVKNKSPSPRSIAYRQSDSTHFLADLFSPRGKLNFRSTTCCTRACCLKFNQSLPDNPAALNPAGNPLLLSSSHSERRRDKRCAADAPEMRLTFGRERCTRRQTERRWRSRARVSSSEKWRIARGDFPSFV